jgi:hypothetical protein
VILGGGGGGGGGGVGLVLGDGPPIPGMGSGAGSGLSGGVVLPTGGLGGSTLVDGKSMPVMGAAGCKRLSEKVMTTATASVSTAAAMLHRVRGAIFLCENCSLLLNLRQRLDDFGV